VATSQDRPVRAALACSSVCVHACVPGVCQVCAGVRNTVGPAVCPSTPTRQPAAAPNLPRRASSSTGCSSQ
jgi:hypothetical protein